MVTRDTRWPAGTPCWVDVSVDDIPKAIAFYEALFGWDIQVGGPEAGGYSIARSGGRIVAGIGPKMGPPEAPPGWTTYLATDNVDATAAKVKDAGGQVLAEPVDVMSEGRMAVATDTIGAVFGLWQGGSTPGIGLANEPGSLSWNEHLSNDFESSKSFYQAVFGYEYDDMSGGDFRYATIKVGGNVVGGIGSLPLDSPRGPTAGWAVYFAVADTDAAVARLAHLGGTVLQPARDSEFGRIAVVADDHDAAFSLITPPRA